MNYIKLFLLIIVINGVYSCDRKRLIIASEDKNQYITILTYKKTKTRYIINGKYYLLPNEGYIKIDVKEIDPIRDGLWGCWINNGWELTNEKANVIENKLDTSKFKFYTKLPRDKWDIPRETKFRNESCFILDFLTQEIEGDGYLL